MAAKIKEKLLTCSQTPIQGRIYACVAAGELGRLLGRIKELDYESFIDVFEYATKLNLPEDFLNELRFEYEKRGI